MASEQVEALKDLLSHEAPDRLGSLVALLRAGTVGAKAERPSLERHLGGSDDSIERIRRCIRSWVDAGSSIDGLTDSIDAVVQISRGAHQPEAELVWTGPDAGHPTARRTKPVVNELLEWAGQRVTIVGYSLFLGGADAAELMQKLGSLSSRGVTVEFIVDRRYAGWDGKQGEGHSVREIQRHWPQGVRRPIVRSWKSESDSGSKLHAKVMIVDRQDLLVTSANLTGAGLARNLELGMRVRGKVANDCAEHFQRLVNSAFFDLEPWPEPA